MERKKIIITKDCIASIALLYNYISNEKLELSDYKIIKYFSDIAMEFIYPHNRFLNEEFIFSKEKHKYIDLIKNNEDKEIYYHLLCKYLDKENLPLYHNINNISEKNLIGISIDNNGKYHLENLKAVIDNYLAQPIEIINSTLNPANLNTIDVISSRIETFNIDKQYSGFIDICTMTEEKAISTTKQMLKDSRFNNIKAKCYYLGTKPDHTFRVYYYATHNFKSFNTNSIRYDMNNDDIKLLQKR